MRISRRLQLRSPVNKLHVCKRCAAHLEARTHLVHGCVVDCGRVCFGKCITRCGSRGSGPRVRCVVLKPVRARARVAVRHFGPAPSAQPPSSRGVLPLAHRAVVRQARQRTVQAMAARRGPSQVCGTLLYSPLLSSPLLSSASILCTLLSSNILFLHLSGQYQSDNIPK